MLCYVIIFVRYCPFSGLPSQHLESDLDFLLMLIWGLPENRRSPQITADQPNFKFR